MSYAGFWKRVGAAIVDSLLVWIVTIPITFALGTSVAGTINAFLANLAIGWLYFSIMESSTHQATLGKMALSIKVTDIKGKRISFGRATGRHFAKFLSVAIIFIGYLMVAFTEKKQGLHDMIAGTLVVTH